MYQGSPSSFMSVNGGWSGPVICFGPITYHTHRQLRLA